MNVHALALSLAAAFALNAGQARAVEVTSVDRAAIAAIIAAEAAAWNAGDAAAFAAPTTPDVVFTNIVGLFSVGRAPFIAQHARIFATIYKGSTMDQRVEHIAMVGADVAVVDTLTSVGNFASLPPGMSAAGGKLRTRLEQVMVRGDHRWSVAAFHNVAINEAALAAGPPPK